MYTEKNNPLKICIYHIYYVYLHQNSENYGSNS